MRERFDRASVAKLCALAWWNWPIETILENEAKVMAGDVDALAAVVV